MITHFAAALAVMLCGKLFATIADCIGFTPLSLPPPRPTFAPSMKDLACLHWVYVAVSI